MDKVDTVIRILGVDHLTKLPFVTRLSEKTKVPANVLVVSAIGILALLCFFVVFGTVFTTLTMFLFPAYDTYKAIESKDQAAQSRLLTYWMVFGTTFALDTTFRFILSFLPFYHLIRAAILFVFYSRSINGAEYVYQYVQKPAFEKVQAVVDEFITPVEAAIQKVGEKVDQKLQKKD